MRNLEDIERDLAAAREALSSVEGTPAEVYSRIVGYYRSVRNWNRGKREEYGERQLYRIGKGGGSKGLSAEIPAAAPSPSFSQAVYQKEAAPDLFSQHEFRILLFVRASCPGCVQAKAAAARLGIPVDLVNADTPEGMARAIKLNVLSTPTAILISPSGEELQRTAEAETINRFKFYCEPIAV